MSSNFVSRAELSLVRKIGRTFEPDTWAQLNTNSVYISLCKLILTDLYWLHLNNHIPIGRHFEWYRKKQDPFYEQLCQEEGEFESIFSILVEISDIRDVFLEISGSVAQA